MKAIILAAGRGSRMCSLTHNKPKCLIEIGGKPLLRWQLESLKGAGINEIGIVRGYLGSYLDQFVDQYRLFNNENWQNTNMVFSLCCAEKWLNKYTCIVSYSDIIYSTDAVNILKDAEGDIVITYDPNWFELWSQRFEDPLIDAETFQIDNKGRLLEIGNKAKTIEEIKGQYMGLFKITPKGWKIIQNYLSTKDNYCIMCVTELLQNLIKNGIEINAIPIRDRWYELDNENDIKICQDLVW